MSDPNSSVWSVPEWPQFGLASDVRPALAAALAAGRPSVLASLYAVEGAAPLGQGAQMLFDRGAAAGFLSGGCVEGDVALHAQAALQDGGARRLVYGRGGPPDIQLLCGSRIEVLLERIDPADPAAVRLLALGAARRPALWLSDGQVRACLAEGEAAAAAPAGLRAALRQAESRPAAAGFAGGAVFRRHAPAFRLVVVGGDPITLAIARLAADAGFEAALVRPKGPAAPPPLSGVRYFRGEPAQAFAELGLDPWTAVAIATHDIDIDHDALAPALASSAAYVGALGSRKRIPERVARLKADGLGEAAISRLKAPIGLDIGVRSPWPIAVSVIAEVIQTLQARENQRAWPALEGDVNLLYALVLAAGSGSRFGGRKLLSPWRGGVLLDGALGAALAAPVRAVAVVVGADAAEVAAAALALAERAGQTGRLKIVQAPDYALGLSASLRAGLAALPAEADGVLVFLGDMPVTPLAVLEPLAEALAAGAPAAVPVFEGRRGHPAAISRALFAELMVLSGDRGAGAVLDGPGDRLVTIPTDDPGVLLDVDRPGEAPP